jgi:hypothetical protein
LDESTALSNLGRYQSLALECPVTLAVENSGLPPHVILNLAVRSKIYLAYDQDAIHSRETLLTYQKQKGVIQ